jgi:branched-chain amino acid aminotransferase
VSERQIWCDGQLIPWDQARVHVMSHSLQRGTLAFDYLGIHDTPRGPALFRLMEHIDRLLHTCSLVGLPLAYDRDQLREAVLCTARVNPAADSVKISVLIPSIEVEIVPQDFRTSVYVAVYHGANDIVARNRGTLHQSATLKIHIERDKRNRRQDILAAQAKVAANYAFALAAKVAARARGFDDILLLDDAGMVAEAPTSNVFIVDAGNRLLTPPLEQVLHGITRDSVLQIARSMGIACAETNLCVDDLFIAQEAFLTGSTLGCKPIVSFDGRPVAAGECGEVTRAIDGRLRAAMAGAAPEFAHWLTPVED